MLLEGSAACPPLTRSKAISIGLPSGGCLQHSTKATNENSGAPSHPLTAVPPVVWRRRALPCEPRRFWNSVDSEHTPDMSCCGVNKPKRTAQSFSTGEERRGEERRGGERGSEWVISACLRHYDAVPYLTMLLFCKSSAPVWPAGAEREREWEDRKRDAEGKDVNKKKYKDRELKRVSDTERGPE